MAVTIALAGNPNCGKTTLFNQLTGSNRYVGNRPGVTVEKIEGRLKGDKNTVITDLPGIYSLSPYTLEEAVARDYIIDEAPDVILNVTDASNLQRSLYLTTQLAETGTPLLIALNMTDIAKKHGYTIDVKKLSILLNVPVAETDALKGIGTAEAAKKAVCLAGTNEDGNIAFYSAETEAVLQNITALIKGQVNEKHLRWFAVKLFERDEKVLSQLNLPQEIVNEAERLICEREYQLQDSAESIIINERYSFIEKITAQCMTKKENVTSLSEKIDRILTGRFLAFPFFIMIMTLVYFLSAGPFGSMLSNWAKEGIFGEGWFLFGIGRNDYQLALQFYGSASPYDYGIYCAGIPVIVQSGLEAVNCAGWLKSLIVDGIIGGVGSVLGFLPQLAVLFLLLALLEECGYMSRIAFIMDRLFRRFGLSGKSVIPMLIATGCGVPAIMSSRTIENPNHRRMTIITSTFMPCGAKLPAIAMVAGLFFGGAWWMAPLAYFIGAAAVLLSGLMLNKTRLFSDEESPFIMELPDYHAPFIRNIIRTVREQCLSFVKKAGTLILLASITVWFLSNFGCQNGIIFMASSPSDSILRNIGELAALIFAPLGFGNWQAAVASIMGLLAKEELVGVFGVLASSESITVAEIFGNSLSAFSFLIFNLLCAPCIAAVSAIRKEMNSRLWTAFTICYQTLFAYAVSFCIYQLGSYASSGNFTFMTAISLLIAIAFLFMLSKPSKKRKIQQKTQYKKGIPANQTKNISVNILIRSKRSGIGQHSE